MSNTSLANGSQHVTLVLDGVFEPVKFWATTSSANELFDKFRRVIDGIDPPDKVFFIDVSFDDGTIERHAIPMWMVRLLSTIPSAPSPADALKRLADIAEKESRHGDE